MKHAIYAGSFNPWHKGHQSVLDQALKVFDTITILIGHNPSKDGARVPVRRAESLEIHIANPRVKVTTFTGLLTTMLKHTICDAQIKGLRNSEDFEYEKIQQYWNEDLGLAIPTFYIIADRNLTHVSSSAIKAIEAIKKGD
jgi:pantetheine-phosphate adenylyltransferase